MAALYRIQSLITGLPGGEGLATFHFLAAGGSGQSAQDAVDDFWDALNSAIKLGVAIVPTNELITFEDTTGEALSFTSVSGIGQSGSETTDALGYANQGLIRWRTSAVVAGRRLQGRTFIPGPTEVNSDTNGRPVNAYKSLLQTAGDTLINAPACTPVVWSRPQPGRAGSHAEITTADPWSEWAVLRGRR